MKGAIWHLKLDAYCLPRLAAVRGTEGAVDGSRFFGYCS